MPLNPQYPSGVLDTRSDLGYGTTKSKFHKPRSFNQYPEPEDEDLDGELKKEFTDEDLSGIAKFLNLQLMLGEGINLINFVFSLLRIRTPADLFSRRNLLIERG